MSRMRGKEIRNMSNWKARMPRALPGKGKVSYVMAFKTDSGARVEYSGELPEGKAARLLKLSQLPDDQFDEILSNTGL